MRPFNSGDHADFHALCNDSLQMKYASGENPLTLEKSRDTLEKMMNNFDEAGYGLFAVIERKEKRFIGLCGLQLNQNSGQIELDYALSDTAWGKGYATEACMEVLRFALGELGIERIVATALEQDRSSTRVLEKIGMVYSGHERFNDQEVVLYTIASPQKTAGTLFQSTYHHPSNLSMSAL
jgi:RimJ/RimL family protein N-acetyltransferase